MLEKNPEAIFTQWLKEHSSSVLKVARAYTLTEEDCQDLAQEILLQAWRSLPGFEGKSNPATWFYRVALNTAMNWQRKEQSRRTYQKPLLDLQAVPASESRFTEQAEQRETIEQLYDAIHRMPPPDIALVLLYLDDMNYRDMASVLGISENNVGVKLNRAKKTLTELMNQQPAEARRHES